MHRTLALLLLGASLAACQSNPARGPDSPWFAPPVGTRLALHETLLIPPEQVSLYFQDGRLLPGSGRDQFRPWCKFEHRLRVDRPLTVSPDTFTVTRVEQRRDQVLGMPAPLPMLHVGFFPFSRDDASPSHIVYATRLYLHSPQQPGVLRLTCGHWEDGGLRSRPLTVNEMRAALGETFSLEIPGEG